MKKYILIPIILIGLLFTGCANSASTDINNDSDAQAQEAVKTSAADEVQGTLDGQDLRGLLRMYVDEPHVQALSESGPAESEYNVLFASTMEYSLDGEGDVVSQIINSCMHINPKEAAQMEDLVLLGAAPYQKCIFPRIILGCQSGYIYYIEFYAPLPEGSGVFSYQNEYGKDGDIVVFISKLIDPLDDDTYEYASRYGRRVNLWTAYIDSTGTVGCPWISVIVKEDFDVILDLIQGMDVYKTVDGVGDWQELPEFDELYKGSEESNASDEPTDSMTEGDSTDDISAYEDMETFFLESPDFQMWRWLFTFMPAYTPDDAEDLLRDLIQNAGQYGFMDYYTGYDYTADKISETDVKAYINTFFHVTDAEYEAAREAVINEEINQPFYEEGYFSRHPAGSMGIGAGVKIDSIEENGEHWIIRFHLYDNDGEMEWEEDTISQVDMSQELIDGQLFWTMYSMER